MEINLEGIILEVYEYKDKESVFYFKYKNKEYMCVYHNGYKLAEMVEPLSTYLSIKWEKHKLNIKQLYKDSFDNNKVYTVQWKQPEDKIYIETEVRGKKYLPKKVLKWY